MVWVFWFVEEMGVLCCWMLLVNPRRGVLECHIFRAILVLIWWWWAYSYCMVGVVGNWLASYLVLRDSVCVYSSICSLVCLSIVLILFCVGCYGWGDLGW